MKNNLAINWISITWNIRKVLIVFGLVFGVVMLWSIIYGSSTVFAGGVGAGGSGSGGGGGHQTSHGFSWASYPVSGSGPSDGFRNGTGWGTVQDTCRNGLSNQEASTVYIYTILDSDGTAMGYNYWQDWSWPTPPPEGSSWDNGNATTIASSTALNAYNNLPAEIDKTGFRFGGNPNLGQEEGNVAWFCYDYTPTRIPAGTIYTSKYYPPDEPNDGADTAEYPSVVNDAQVSLTNRFGSTFVSNTANPWDQGGIWVSDNSYSVSVNVPAGYRINKTNGRPFSCTGAENTGTCTITGVDVSDGGIAYVDFWFEAFPVGSFDNAVCNPSTGVASLTGWAFDPDFPTAPIEIHLYADGPAGTGTWDGIRHKADRSRPDVNAAYPATGNSPHGFNIDVSQYSDAYTHTFYLYAIGTSSSSGRQDVNRANTPLGSRTIGPCRPPTCTVSAFPTDPQVNQQFSLSLNYTYSPGGRGLAIAPVGRVGLSNPANSAPFPFLSSRNGQGHDFPGYSKNTIGRFPVYGSLALNGYTVQCLNNGDVNRGVRVVDKPYLVQVNGDVASGTGIAGPQSCVGWNSSSANSGTITTWDGGISGGPGTNLATYALAVINGFASAQTPSGSFGGPSPPKNLSFANSSGTYGGSFGGGIPCPTDYYSKKPAGLSAPAGTVTNSNMDYSTTGNITLAGGGLSGGNRSAIYVRGNVYISSNITLSSGATIDTLSSFYLVVQGNIYIAPSVTQLDGVYVAQPGSGGGGLIYTCSNNFNPPTVAQLNGVCKNQLTVNGAFIAKETKLYRSYGTLITGTPAEIFNYTPATWLVAPSSIGEETGSSYDAITSLPPVL